MQNIVHDVEKNDFFHSGDPSQIKNSERSATGHANTCCTRVEFWSKTHLGRRRSSAQTQLRKFAGRSHRDARGGRAAAAWLRGMAGIAPRTANAPAAGESNPAAAAAGRYSKGTIRTRISVVSSEIVVTREKRSRNARVMVPYPRPPCN